MSCSKKETEKTLNSEKQSLLLKQFNNRDSIAFDQIYLLYYNELSYFASNLYRNTTCTADDVVQDIFLNLWGNKKQKFDDFINIKAYLFVSVKNRFKDYCKHQKQIDKHTKQTLDNCDYFISQMVEVEVFSFIEDAVGLLPEECCKVFIEYLNGLEVKEIAEKLSKSEYTVYKQRKTAIDILKTKLPKDKMLIIMMLMGQ